MDSELILAVGSLIESTDSLRGEVHDLKAYGRRNRRLIRIVTLSVIFDVLLSFGLGYATWRASRASDQAARASSALTVNCLAGNESRKIQTDLWNTVLAFPQPNPTPEQEAQTQKFKDYIATAFVIRDCK